MEQKNWSKNEWRNAIREQKKMVSAEILRTKSEKILRRLEQLTQFAEAQTVMLYISLADEVQTHDFIKKWQTKKRILVPKTVENKIFAVEITKKTDFAVGNFGVLEPQNGAIFSEKIDFIAIPGVAFDTFGNRLGRGKGCYDAFLAKNLNSYKVGLCFDFQFVNQLPTEPHDIKMDKILFE